MYTNRKIVSLLIRPLFAIFLFISQFLSGRKTFFTEDTIIVIAGIIIFIIGVYINIISGFHLTKSRKNKKISKTGPYKLIRHPIYLSIYILSIGMGLIFFSPIWFVVLLLFIPFWIIECKKEEAEMIELYKNDYLEYRMQTKMFIPKIY